MKQAIKEIIVLTAAYYGVTIKPEVLAMYAEDLSDLDPAEVLDAYKTYRRDPKNKTMPLPAHIREIIQPTVSPDAMAREIAGRCMEAVKEFGWPSPEKARAFIGEEGWSVIRSVGGWQHFCEELGVEINPQTFYAQCRERVRDQIQFNRGQIQKAYVEKIEQRRSKDGYFYINEPKHLRPNPVDEWIATRMKTIGPGKKQEDENV